MTLMDSGGLDWRIGPSSPICPPASPRSNRSTCNTCGAGIHRGVVVVEVVKMEVNALIQNVEPELVAYAAVLIAYTAAAVAFVSHFL